MSASALKNQMILHNKLQINPLIYALVRDEIIPDTGIKNDEFWDSFQEILKQFMPKNEALLETRNHLQTQIDNWHVQHKNKPHDANAYQQFLHEINYISSEVLDDSENCNFTTQNIDTEISQLSAPQFVVAINNARYALKATNARWGSLFDAFYGTDVIPEDAGLEKGDVFNPRRGKEVIALAVEFLDEVLPLTEGSHEDVSAYTLIGTHETSLQVQIYLNNGHISELKYPKSFLGYEENGSIFKFLFRNHNLHFEVQIDPCSPIGMTTLAGLKDIILEAAVTTIQDCEDSIAAVDAEDKVLVYKNWLELMQGSLETTVTKNNEQHTRRLHADREYTSPIGEAFSLNARGLMIIRHVGLLMTTDAVQYQDENGIRQNIPEGILDAMITTLAFLHDYHGNSPYKNSANNNMYIVKPKMHGADEVRFIVDLFSHIEQALKLPINTLKLGIMDEERRTTVNLKACIKAASDRIFFINTGFLDRTGDEIHTSMEAGVFFNKTQLRNQPWMSAYEDHNVDIGLTCGFKGKAQIGKGMWTKPDFMAEILLDKKHQPLSGANCAWVSSPTAATLHAIHYHQTNVTFIQQQLLTRESIALKKLLDIPLLSDGISNNQETASEYLKLSRSLNNNAQTILAYVVRWVDQGIGCSKVPDANNVYLMEDRATLRISSQLLANWLHHNIINKDQITQAFKEMALVVDKQNNKNPDYQNMAPDYSGIAFKTALTLVFEGRNQLNGYTEPLLYSARKEKKREIKKNDNH